MERSDKQEEVTFLSDCFARSQVALCVDYRGLSVADITELRRELKKNGAFGRVVKNTLAKISIEKGLAGKKESEVKRFADLLEGPSFLAFSFEDPVRPAKVITKFVKDKQKLTVKGAWVDGAFVEGKGVDVLATMPGREEVLSQLLRLLSTPATQLVRLLNAPAQQTVQALEAHRRNLEGKAA